MRNLPLSIFARFTIFSIAFVLASAATVVTGVLALDDITARTALLEREYLGGATLLGEIDYDVSAFRIAELYRSLMPDPGSRKLADTLADRDRQEIDATLAQYVALLGPDTPPQIAQFRHAWARYQQGHDAWVNDPAASIFAPASYLSPLDLRYHATDAAIDHLVDIHRAEAAKQAQAVSRLSHELTIVSRLAGIVEVGFAIVIMLIVRRQIIAPIGAITHAMTRLAGGDRSISVPEMGRGDEIGEMAAACEVFRVNVLALDKAHEAARKAEEQAQTLARHDALTGLPNRRVFSAELEHAVARAQSGEANYSVFLIDLDEFKKINDIQGHQTGDLVLCEVARRIELSLRKNDIVARLGGDEFAIIGEGEPDLHEHLEGAKRLAGRLLGAIRQPMILGESKIEMGASIGIATCRQDAVDVSSLMRGADIAMYRAKHSGRCTFRFFEQSMDDEMRDREALEKDLAKAIGAGEIHPFYQPLVNLDENRIRGFEALARWKHPERGFVPPDVFIPIVEQLGLMTDLTELILRQACRDAKNWPEDIRIAVNFSPLELRDPMLPSRVLTILTQEGLTPKRLEVEITETALVSDIDGAKRILQMLQGLGVTICLDDFGTGYSSLYHLRELKFDKVKIDRSFVNAMQSNAESEKIIDAILGLTKSLQLPTVAEGIENTQVLMQLAAKGCEFGQGFYFGKAVDAEHAGALLKEGVKAELAIAEAI